ncbi:retinoblastoma-like protein 1 isoform X2 [Phyllopteryx taeniolatus]|uniref:retinoblastoma-like protein 1 isoform X2 n=1 Tax=Phyllopteryx taeniolatus TaxID=161469 RepID=UPI002AD3A0A6|nr:retinoblastoma-like protein 1 isoform X2 [Phyllopteryx taeniolatus]
MRGEESSDSESGRMEESVVRRSLETLCQELNMDEHTATEAMDNFTAIWNTYTLEGEVAHWLACSLYAACRKGSTPTVGKGLMEGNCVSLTRILRTAKLSLIEFFSKMRKWSDMSNLCENFCLRVERLERNFEVSTVIFRKFEPIFAAVFRSPRGSEAPPPPPRQPRGRKHRRQPCHVADVFKFCWTLFVYTKGNFHMIGDDLVNSYHLLLCCLDLVFGNALMCANRKELINPAFIGTSGDEVQACADEASPCALERLCELHDGLVVEAKGIKQHYFKPYMRKLFRRQILKGNEDLLTELLDPHNFIDNNKALNREYEEYVLTVGDFDERVFLDAHADEEIGTPRKSFQRPGAGAGQTSAQQQLQHHVEKALLEQDIFQCSLLACSLEVVLFSYSSQRTFPWIINVFKLAPFYFFKVIEVFIRAEEGLSRDMVKHLNQVEEQVLESRAWTADSALWNALGAAGNKVPTVEEVNFPSSLDSGATAAGGAAPSHLPLVALSPIVHPRIREVRSGVGTARKEIPPSPLSVHDRYSSPAAGSAKRRLFGDDATTATGTVTSPAKRLTLSSAGTLKIGPQGQTTVLSIPLPGGGGGEHTITLIPVQPCDSSGGVTAQFLLTASPGRPVPVSAPAAPADTQTGSGRPQRTGSLALFFRKVYHLASVRLRDLCGRLAISSELRAKIWTGFEHSLVHATELMRDRHLDQMLLCTVFIIAKISKETHTFQDIMKCYRSQPQASSHVYRSVLLHRTPRQQVAVSDENMEVDPASGTGSAEKTRSASGGADGGERSPEEERGDLIQFYNNIYMLKMKSFAMRYAPHDNRMDAPPVSPFPSVRCHPPSPRRVSQRHSVYVSPHKASAGGLAPNSFTYRINSSPSKDLCDINRMLRQGCNGRKRALGMEGELMMSSACDSPSKRACPENSGGSPDVLLKRLQDVVSERQSH